MTAIERKRPAESVEEDAAAARTHAPRHRHPCFWGVLDGESLRFVFVSESLHTFLGGERTTAMVNQSLFDYIHPEEANRARRDLADTFVSKSFVGSSIRRFDVDNAGLQQVFRRASESQILYHGRPAQHVHEALERKLSLPTIPDIVKLRANSSQQPPLPAAQTGLQQPMPKRLRTILEDSVGSFAPARNGEVASSVIKDGGSSSLYSRHVQIYSMATDQLLCAFPEDSYQRVHGRPAGDAAKSGVRLSSLWEHCQDKRAESYAMSLLQGPCTPDADPIRLELQIRPGSSGPPTDVQSMFFRWGHLLFVCQQKQGEGTPDPATAIGIDDNILANYNLSTPPSDDPLRPAHAQHAVGAGSSTNNNNSNNCTSSGGSIRGLVRNPSPLNPATALEARPFSLSRAPASVVASLPPRPPPLAPTPPEAIPPRRQSSYTLPPAKSFEERRFSYPIQTLYTDRRPPPLPIPSSNHQCQQPQPQQHHQTQPQPQPHHQQMQQLSPARVSPISVIPGSAHSRGSPVSAVPTSRLADARQRALASASVRNGGSLLATSGSETSGHVTPAISPASAGIVQHTPVSLSPAPQSQPHSANSGYVQVNVYPPPEAGMWRGAHGQHTMSQPQTPTAPGHGYPLHGSYPQSAPRPPPPLMLGHSVRSPHPHILGSIMHDQYHSPIGSAGASPRIAGTGLIRRTDLEKKTCKSCGTDTSPEWRKGPTGHKT
ncbi:hypothetical protein GGF46_000739 [Coemansia sp. RSA 552]|nr:hypothetical protein GGF46_000739 [Coemansia sp. RSA 552]